MKKTILLYYPRTNPDLKPVYTPLSLLCVAKFLDKAGYPIKIVSENLYDDHFGVLKESAQESLIFGVSAMTGYQIYDGLKATQLVKQANENITVVWGGWHPSIYPVQTLENPYIDVVVRGQGERALFDIVQRIETGKTFEGILGVHWKETGKIFSNPDRFLESLDDMPPIPYHLIDLEKCLINTEFGNRTVNYVSSVGCPYRCGFCCEMSVNHRKWKGLRANKVVEDLERLEKEFGVNGVSVLESNFFVDMKRAKAILKGMLEKGLTLKLGNLDGRTKQLAKADNELWELLRQTKSYSILTGAESGDPEALEIIKKDVSVEDNIKFGVKCQQYGIKVLYTTLVGLPFPNCSNEELAKKTDKQISATVEMFDKLLALDERCRGQMFIYVPYPGTPLYNFSLALGFKEPKNLEGWGDHTFYETNTPWITKEQEILVPMLSSYIFMLLDSDTLDMIKDRVKNRFKRTLFIFAFKTLVIVAKLRWKYKFFKFPIDYKIYRYVRSQNKSI
ncbi:MAG: hypothetical protein DRR00_30385 [Candidatus Parabeggiatoa sp. nov. 3]|nr:MAG: hypothetical protein DRR00_30385 [Gammaproteobacteria bacterium]RKZ55623.1 MAG: hypothetical protein DRQ99_29725 [Gammaproteobacteria bacterium]